MPNIFDLILWPFKWAVSAVLWVFHSLFTAIGMDPSSGLTWVLCIICLTLVMRTLTIPLFVKQIKAMRGMSAMQGDIAKLQAKYKGKKDQLSRQAMAQEQMALYKNTAPTRLPPACRLLPRCLSSSVCTRCSWEFPGRQQRMKASSCFLPIW